MRKLIPLAALTLNASACLGQVYTYETISAPTPSNTYYNNSPSTYVYGINGGKIIGTYLDNIDYRAFVYDGINYTYLDAPGKYNSPQTGDAVSTYGLGISGNNIVGYYADSIGSGGTHGYLFDGNTYQQLYTSGAYDLSANGISGNQIAGSYTQGNYVRSFLYNKTTQVYATLPTFFHGGQTIIGSRAQGVSDSYVVGFFSGYDQQIGYKVYGYLYNIPSQAYTALDFPGALGTHAYGVNQSKVVGSYWNNNYGLHGYIYDIATQTYTAIDAPNSLQTYVQGIEGSKIVGYYQETSGQYRGFIGTEINQSITTIINQDDSRVTGSFTLTFQGGTLKPSVATLLTNNVIIQTAGKLDSVNGNINSTGLINILSGANLTIAGSNSSSVTISGNISGAGYVIVEGGQNVISGNNTSAGLTVAGGILSVANELSLPANNITVNGGSLRIHNTGTAGITFGQNLQIKGPGLNGAGAIIAGDINEAGAINFSGMIRLADSATLASEGLSSAVHTFSGGITTLVPGTSLSISVGQNSLATINSNISNDILSISKTGPGELQIDQQAQYSGIIYVYDGTLYLKAPNAAPNAIITVNGGALHLEGAAGTITPISQNLQIILNKATTSGAALVLRSSNSGQNKNLNANILLVSATSMLRSESESGYHYIKGNIDSASAGSVLALDVGNNSLVTLAGTIGENISTVNKTGTGQLNINGQIFGSLTSNGGTVTISPNGSIGTTGNVFVNTSLVIESNLSGERQFGSRLSLSGNGPTGASLTIGTPNANGIVTLTSSIDIVGPSVIRTPNSGVTSVNFNGPINASGQNLTIETNSLSEATISSTLISNRLDKNEGGLLTISGSASANINVNAGTLKVNGNVNGSVTVSAVSKLKGSGTINGNVTNFGTVAPGNSPGVLIINGSYTASPGSFYEAEVAGLGGAGVFNGHDSIVVTGTPGTFSFQNGSGLKAIKLNAFEPAKGNAFRIINASGGISGAFSSFTSQFNQWVLFDKSTGSLYGTGLAAGQTFSTYSPNLGEVIWLNSINAYSNDPTNGYTGTFDSNTVWGNAALSLIRGELLPGSSDGSPYAALGAVVQSELRDSARTSLEALQSRRFERVTTSRTTWEGYLQYSSLKASTTRFETNSNGITAGMLCDVNPISTIGFGITSYDSSTIFSNAYGNSIGRSYSLTMFASTMLDEKSRKTFLDGGVQFGNTTSKTKRTTFLGQQSSNVRADNLGAFIRIGSATMLTDSLSATTYTGLDYVHSNTPSFNEQGDLTSLSVATNTGKSMHAQLGADLNWSFKSGSTSARMSLGTEVFFELLDGNTYDISYNYQGAPQSVATGKHYPRTGLRFAPRIEISPGRNSSYYLNISVELNGGSSQSSLNLGYKAKF